MIFSHHMQADYAHYLCFVLKYLDGATAQKERFRFAPPHFSTKLQSFAINLPSIFRLKIIVAKAFYFSCSLMKSMLSLSISLSIVCTLKSSGSIVPLYQDFESKYACSSASWNRRPCLATISFLAFLS